MANNETDMTLVFGGNAAGAVEAAAEVKGATASLAPMVAQLNTQTAQLNATTLAMSSSMAAMALNVAKSEAEIEKEELSLKALADMAIEAKEAMIGFGEAALAFFAVEAVSEWANKMTEGAEKASQMGAKLGMTTSEVQGWNAVATLTGRSADQFSSAFTRLTNSLVKGAEGSKLQAAAMKDLGLSAADALHPSEAILKVADAMAEMGDGPGQAARKVADAMALMGRSGADMIPILSQGSEAIREMMNDGKLAGTVLDDLGNAHMREATEAVNKFKLEMQGLSTQTFVQLIPLVESAAHGMSALAGSIIQAIQPGSEFRKVLGDIVKAAEVGAAMLGTYLVGGFVATNVAELMASEGMVAFMANLGLMNEMAGAGAAIQYALAAGVEAATAAVAEFTIALLANPLTWVVGAVGLLAAGLVYLSGATKEEKAAQDDLNSATDGYKTTLGELSTMTADQIKFAEAATEMNLKLARAHLEAAQGALTQAKAEASLYDTVGLGGIVTFITGVKSKTKAVDDEEAAIQKLLDTLGLYDKATAGPAAPPLKTKDTKEKGQETAMQKLQEGFDKEQLANKTMLNDMAADELVYWKGVENGTKMAALTEAEQGEVRRKVDTLQHQQDMAGLNDTVAGYKSASTQEIASIKARAAAAKAAADDEIKSIQENEKLGIISHETAFTQIAAQIEIQKQAVIDAADAELYERENTDAQIMVMSAKTTGAFKAAQADEVQAVIEAEKAKAKARADATRQQDASSARFVIARAADAKTIADFEKRAAQDTQKAWDKSIGGAVNNFAQGMLQMARGSTTFRQFANNEMAQVESAAVKGVAKIVSNWLEGEAIKTLASTTNATLRKAIIAIEALFGITTQGTTGTAEVASNAAIAGSAAFASTAAIPLIGPELAPAAAAAAYAGAMTFSPMASAFGGWGNVPLDGMLTQLHKQEMVLPASIASPLRSMLASGGSGETAMASMGGSNHFTLNITTPDGHSVQRFFDQHGDKLVKTLKSQYRQNSGVKAG